MKKLVSLTCEPLELKVFGGSNISTVMEEALYLQRLLRTTLSFSFNEVDFVVDRDTTLSSMTKHWDEVWDERGRRVR